MLVLGLDTSTLVASVALVAGHGETLEVRAAHDGGVDTHSERLLPLVDQVLSEAGVRVADLDALAVGAGPGSFTGLRIGMATAKGLAFAAGKPLHAVSSLAALALDCALHRDPGRVPIAAVMDARRAEIFLGLYRWDGLTVQSLADERVLPPAELEAALVDLVSAEPVIAVGDGLEIYADLLGDVGQRVVGARATPSGAAVARLAITGSYDDVLKSGTPVYIRPSEAEVKFPDGNPGGTFRPPRK
jgi:tRNA threonylcarbamoyladenosine biosynthesis protein TsaB